MAKILVTHGVPDAFRAILKDHEVVYPGALKHFSTEEIKRHVQDADAVMACGAFDKAHFENAERLKIIANYGAGYDRIDVSYATKRGIYVTNTPDATAYPTAETAIGLILDASRRIGELNTLVRNVEPETLFGMGRYMGMGLYGNTLGIIGMGHIGGIVAAFGRLMGMRVLYYNRRRAKEENGAAYAPLDELLRESDVVSIHCPLTDETRGLLSKERLDLMKPRSVLVNTARAAVVDYDALYEKLLKGELFAAGLDVFMNEPHIPKELIALQNVVITPHIGTNTLEARNAMGNAAASRILQVLNGQIPSHVVNPEVIKA